MVEFYLLQIRMNQLELNDVPQLWYQDVKDSLEKEV